MKTGTQLPPQTIRHIDSGFYHVSDKTAGALARASKHGKLPRYFNLAIDVTLADGRTAVLQRTSVSCRSWRPKRNWVWAVFAIRHAAE